jgi:hypothetical protein
MDVQKLFEATRHDAVLTAAMLVMMEAGGGEPVEIPEDTPWRQSIAHHMREFREALGIEHEEVAKT